MATVNANIINTSQVIFSLGGKNVFTLLAELDIPEPNIGDTVRFNTQYSFQYLISALWLRRGSIENITPFNINDSLSSVQDNYTLKFTRTGADTLLQELTGVSDTTITASGNNFTILPDIAFKFSDGKYSFRFTYAGGINETEILYTEYFPILSGTFAVSAFGYNQVRKNGGIVFGGNNTTPQTDPYSGAGDSGTGGGDGTFDGSSDAVPVPSLPSIGATDTGFISLFVPSASQIRQVASYLWSNFFDLATFKKLFEDPMDCILGLSVVPVSVPTSGSAQITVGNIELSGISLPLASQQYVEVDCGTVDFTNRFFGSYLDFEPYTKMSLFVPYSGVHAVSADDIIGKVVGLKYHIDILTGSLVAFLTCGNSVLYEFNGACASNIPVNSMNYASTIENAIRIAVNIGTTVATAGAAAPLTGENVAARTAAKEFGTGVAIAGSTAEGALSLKPSIDRAGSLGGTTGLMGNQIPYFIITRPRMCKPKNQDFFQGYPSFIQTTLGRMEGTGFTAFENVVLAGSYLTDTEKAELESILKSGVYL